MGRGSLCIIYLRLQYWHDKTEFWYKPNFIFSESKIKNEKINCFSVSYATIVGMNVECICRYLFFSYTRKDIALPLIVKKLLLEEVSSPYFPQNHTYFQMALIPAVMLVSLFFWSKVYPKVRNLVNIAIILCNTVVTLFFFIYMNIFFYCLYLFSVPLNPPTSSSWASVMIKCIFITSCSIAILSFFYFVYKHVIALLYRNNNKVIKR